MKMRRTQPFYLGHPAKPLTCIETGVASSKKEGADGDTQLRKPDNCNPAEMAIIHMQREFQELYVFVACVWTEGQPIGTALSFFHCFMRGCALISITKVQRRVGKGERESRDQSREADRGEVHANFVHIPHFSSTLLFGWPVVWAIVPVP